MKRILYNIFVLGLLLGGCTTEKWDDDNRTEGVDVAVQFTVDIPEPVQVKTRSTQQNVINENQINDLYLLVFDESGRFLTRKQATLSGTTFTATLSQTRNKRIVHFIANYDWSNFSDQASLTKDEGEVIASMQTNTLVFWQRMELSSGISANVFASQPVSLIRNMAKFTLENTASTLSNVKFAVYNKPSMGSVAPFNTNTRTFDRVVTVPPGTTFTDLDAMDTAPSYAFERKNSTVMATPTYVIIQGTYNGSTSYYKIDIVDTSHNMYDIMRNTWFKIKVESVTMAGYSTLAETQSSPASNNIAASVLLQSYPTISDGSYVLSVDKTIISFTSNGQTLNAKATYQTVAGVSQNSTIVVTLVQDPLYPVINGNVSYNVTTGALTAAINDVPAGGAARFATIKIEAGYLSRTIRLLLHAPFNFSNISVTPAVLNNTLSYPATLKFTIPAEAQYLLPMYCYITTAYLTPDFGNIEVIHEDGVYKYKWKVNAVGEQTINFKTNTANAAETIFLEADLFHRGQVIYTNSGGGYRFSNVVITPNPVDFGTGKPVSLRFTVPTAGTFRIYTNNLTPVSGSVSGGYYSYTATSGGEQIVAFTTNKQNCAESIKITGTNYTDYVVSLRNQLVTLSGTLTFGNASTTLPINAGIVNILIGGKVEGIVLTTSTGGYSASIEAKIGDVLTYSYNSGTKIYTTTVNVTGAAMTVSKKLL